MRISSALIFDQTIVTAQESLKTQNLNLASDEQKLDAVLDVVNSAATEQRNYWQKTSADSDKTVKALRIAVDRASLLLDHTDKNLNGALLPDVDREFGFTAQSAQMAFDSVGKTADAATFQINDLGPTMTNLGETSARLANAAAYFQSASGHADKILADGEKTADYYEKKLNNTRIVREAARVWIARRGLKAWQHHGGVCEMIRATGSLLGILLLTSCTAIPNRMPQDRCYVYIESEDICVQHGGEVIRRWSDSHPWEEGRERHFEVDVDLNKQAWVALEHGAPTR